MGTNNFVNGILEPRRNNFTRDGRYFPDNLLERYPDGTLRVHKENYFRYAKHNGFADSAANYTYYRKLEHYIDAIKKLIKSRAFFGWKLDEEESRKTDFIVFKRHKNESFEISTAEAIRQAKLVLNI